MRICVISPGVVHATPRTIALADQFEEVHFIDIIGNADRAALESCGAIYHGPAGADEELIKGRRLSALLKEIQPEAIICHYASGMHYFRSISFGRSLVAVIAMGSDVLYEQGSTRVSAVERLLIRMALRRSNYVSAKSVFLAERIKKYGGALHIDVNYWGADMCSYHPGDRVAARHKLSLDENCTIILSPRALQPLYNVHLIVEAFHAVLSRHKSACLVLLGRESHEYRIKVEETINRLNINDKVSIIGDVSQNVLPLYYQASDVVVSMARTEGFPNTVLEVMACNVPVVVGRISQVEELLAHNKNAWLCEIEPKTIAAALLDVLGDQDNKQRIAYCAYETAREHADIKKNALRFSEHLKQVAAKYRRPSTAKIILFRILYFSYQLKSYIARLLTS